MQIIASGDFTKSNQIKSSEIKWNETKSEPMKISRFLWKIILRSVWLLQILIRSMTLATPWMLLI